MAESFSIRFDSAGLDAGLDELLAAAQQHARPAAQAGAQVLYDEARLRCPVAEQPRKLKGGRLSQPGQLKRSIYQVYSKDHSGADHATYHISWNARTAPHGHLVEFGTSRAPAHPFLRPAFDARQDDALRASHAKYTELMQAVIQGLKS